MLKPESTRLRLMTYNIGGGRKDSGIAFDSVIEVIRKEAPDVLVLQEATEWLDAEQHWHITVSMIAGEIGRASCRERV